MLKLGDDHNSESASVKQGMLLRLNDQNCAPYGMRTWHAHERRRLEPWTIWLEASFAQERRRPELRTIWFETSFAHERRRLESWNIWFEASYAQGEEKTRTLDHLV